MCRLAGITHFDFDAHRDLADRFFDLAENGMVMEGDPPGHLDGWGISYYRDGKAFTRRSGAPLNRERGIYYSLLREIGQSPVLILHLRKSAWPMTTAAEHAHPFEHGNVVFAHNGTVRDFEPLLAEINDREGMNASPRDTEVIFRYMMGLVKNGMTLENAFARLAVRIRSCHVYSALNVLFSDGNTLFACRDHTRAPDYYTLFSAQRGNSALISSEPLSAEGTWTPLPEKLLITFPLKKK